MLYNIISQKHSKTHNYLLKKVVKSTKTNNVNKYGYSISILYKAYRDSMNIRVELFID